MIVGRQSSQDLAALSLGIVISVSVMVAMFGVMSVLAPEVGRLHGAGRDREVGHEMQQGLYLALGCSALAIGLLFLSRLGFGLAGVPAALRDKVWLYIVFIALSVPFSLTFRVYSGVNLGLSRPLFVTLVQVAALPLKTALSAWFVFGGAGLAPLGSPGAGLATLITMMVMAAVGVCALRWHPSYAPYRLFERWHPPSRARLAHLLRLGVPSGLSLFIEVTSFTMMAVFITRFGTVMLAGHQIAANAASVLYMLPLSLGIATSALVAQELGARRPRVARQVAFVGCVAAACTSVTLGLLVFTLRGPIARLYTPDPQVAALAASLFVFIAAYQLGDALQCMGSFVLRAYRIATLPTLIYAFALWGLGLGGGYLLGFGVLGSAPLWTHGANGFWLSNAVSLLIVAGAFMAVLRYVSAQAVAEA
ncbi:MAG: MATE family efflux transporter [Betaproteobacteria bacterium]|nr:MATE family efflux transporter [Betaproteobacteria bacterium]